MAGHDWTAILNVLMLRTVYNYKNWWLPVGPHGSLVPGSLVLGSTVYTYPKLIKQETTEI